MQRNSMILALGLLILTTTLCGRPEVAVEENDRETVLWPEIEPFDSGLLQLSDLHTMFYERCGHPEGKPVFVLHGGPGAAVSPYYRRFFNPEVFHIVLYDQRGCGRSRPFAELRDNTTPDLVNDIDRLRNHLGLDKIILFGGSWGSTLALAYAESYPEHVSGMILRGIFTATRQEIDHFYGNGVRYFFPELVDRVEQDLGGRLDPALFLKNIQSPDQADRMRYSRLWSGYEFRIAGLDSTEDEVAGLLAAPGLQRIIYSLALIENHYMANGCFLREGELLDGTDRIKHIPTILVNGRYDMICPPINAYRLHRRLENSQLLIIPEAGHGMNESGISRALLAAMRDFE